MTKKVTGPVPQTPDEFTFVVTGTSGPDDVTIPMPFTTNPATFTITPDASTNESTYSFADNSLVFEKDGTYTYKISEQQPAESVLEKLKSYDKNTFIVTCVVENGTVTTTITKGSASVSAIEFTNEYKPLTTELNVTKKVTGTDAQSADNFTFVLKAIDGGPMPAETATGQKELTISGKTAAELRAGVTSAFGEIEFVKNGTYTYKIEETNRTNNNYVYDTTTIHTIEITAANRQLSVLIDGTAAVKADVYGVTFTNYRKTPGVEIPVTKNVSGPAPENIEKFSFTIETVDNTAGVAVSAMPLPGGISIENFTTTDSKLWTGTNSFTFGDARFTKDGEYVYLVKETAGTNDKVNYDASQYRVTLEVKDGSTSIKSVKKSENSGTSYSDVLDNKILFTNIYKPLSTELTVTKTLSGASAGKSDTFTFTLTADNTANTPMPDGSTAGKKEISCTGACNKESFGSIKFAENGEWTYTITETKGSNENIIYDSTNYNVVVTVASGELSVSIDRTTQQKAAAYGVEFTNYYRTKSAQLQVTKTIDGPEPASHNRFYFTIAPKENTAGIAVNKMPLPNPVEVYQVGPGSDEWAAFNPITFDKDGTYTYEVTEMNTAPSSYPGWIKSDVCTYDPTVYTVVFEVKDGSVTPSIKVRSEEKEKIVFNNVYDPLTTTFGVTKVIKGAAVTDPIRFTFKLTGKEAKTLSGSPMDAPVPMPADSTNSVLKKTTTGAGDVSFGEISYTSDGVYTYTIEEIKGSDTDYVYDGTKYDVKVVVDDRVVTKTVTIGEETQKDHSGDRFTFTNFHKIPVTVPVVNKYVRGGRPEKDLDYTFTISAVNPTDAPLPENPTITIRGEGKELKEAFGTITFDKFGTYEYKVVENPPAGEGIDPEILAVYDKSEYTITWTIEEDKDPHYVIKKDGQATDSATHTFSFDNEYPWPEGIRRFRISKRLDGGTPDDPNETFTFRFTSLISGAPMPGGINTDYIDVTLPIDSLYEYTSADINFKQPDPTVTGAHYEYKLEELLGEERPGSNSDKWVYDGNVYLIHVDVTYKAGEKPTLKKSVYLNNTDTLIAHEDDIYIFRNYSKITEAVPAVTKSLTGPLPNTVEDFLFELRAVSAKSLNDNTDLPGAIPMPSGSPGGVKSVTISGTKLADGTGEADFGSITFEKDGVYTYTIAEVTGETTGLTYDKTQYQLVWTLDKGIVTRVLTKTLDRDGNALSTPETAASPVFENSYASFTTSIPVEKKVTGNVPEADKTYTFILTAQEGAPMPDGDATVSGNTAQLSLTGKNLMNGDFGAFTFDENGTYEYTIREQDDSASNPDCEYDKTAYTVIVTIANRVLEKMVKIGDTTYTEHSLSFTNDYPDKPVTKAFPSVEKLVDGPVSAGEGDVFTFTLVPGDPDDRDYPMPENDTVTITRAEVANNGGSLTRAFGDIYFDTYGEYTYTLRETVSTSQTAPKTKFDDSVYTITWTVRDGEAAYSIIKDENGTKSTVQKIEFLNQYPGSTQPIIDKHIRGARPQDHTDTYTFELERANASNPMPEDFSGVGNVMRVTIEGDGDYKFAPTHFTESGTYVYFIREVVPANAPYLCLMPEYRITVTYDQKKGEITEKTIEEKDSQGNYRVITQESNLYEFTNYYRTTATFPAIQKEVLGPSPLTPERFVITAVSENAPQPEETEITIEGRGTASNPFGSVTFEADGEYTYTIREKAPEGEAAYQYDPAVYTVTFKVDAGNVTTTVKKDGADTEKISFTNVYPNKNVTLNVKKTVEGVVPAAAQAYNNYTFTLKRERENFPMPTGVSGDTAQIIISGSGSDSFEKMEFDRNGQFTYLISENSNAANTYCEYDGSQYRVTVTISGQADPVITMQKRESGSTAWSEAAPASADYAFAFTNVYPDIPQTAAFPVIRKTIDGPKGAAKDDRFEFVVVPLTVDAPMPENYGSSHIINGPADRSYTNLDFGKITFPNYGSFVYEVYEKVPEGDTQNPNCTYDPAHYFIAFEVTSEGVTTTIYNASEEELRSIEFINKYELKLTAWAIIKKVVSGEAAPEKAETFTFYFERDASTPDAPMPGGVNKDSIEIKVDGGLQKITDEIHFISDGTVKTYKYIIREEDVPEGAAYESRTAPYEITVTIDEAGEMQKSVTQNGTVITQTDNEYTFENYYDLSVTQAFPVVRKIVDGPLGIAKDDRYEFVVDAVTVDAPMPTPASIIIEGKDSQPYQDISFGNITFTKYGTYQYEVYEQLPEGDAPNPNCTYDTTRYSVFFDVTRTGISVTITKGQDTKVDSIEFTNKYELELTTWAIIEKKEKGAGKPAEPETYSFYFERDNSTPNAPMPGGVDKDSIQIKVVGGTEAETEPITFVSDGQQHMYKYIIREADVPEGVTADAPYEITVTIDESGGMSKEVYRDDEEIEGFEGNRYTFTNDYPVEITKPFPTIHKVIEGPQPYPAETYIFEFIAEDGAPLPQNAQPRITGSGNFDFGNITFEEYGTFVYKVSETPGTNKKCTYDSREYTITWTVSKESTTYTITYKDKDGSTGQLSEGAHTLTYTNVYEWPDRMVEAIVLKDIPETNRPKTDEEFIFTFARDPETPDAPMPADAVDGVKIVKLRGTGHIVMGVIYFPRNGVYKYLISEIPGTNTYAHYDSTVYHITVNFTDEGMTKTVTLNDDPTPVSHPGNTYKFVNYYDPIPVTVKFPDIRKFIDGQSKDGSIETFTFKLEAVTPDAPMPKRTEAEIRGDGALRLENPFGEITFEKYGTYVYKVYEVPGTADGLEYDASFYTITWTVADGNAEFSMKREWTDGTTRLNQESFTFENDYETTTEPWVEKSFVNDFVPAEPETYSFTLRPFPADANYPLPADAADGKKTITITGKGRASFGTTDFTEDGEYWYTITEDQGQEASCLNDDNCAYDSTVYKIKLDIVNGVVSKTIWKNDAQLVHPGSVYEFTNTHTVERSFPLVHKKLSGDIPEDNPETFIFELTAEGSAPLPVDENGNPVSKVEITGRGTASFGTITFDRNGTYRYSVSEAKGRHAGVNYDTSIYTITYTVTDGNVSSEIKKNGEQQAEQNEIVFENEYPYPPATADIRVVKAVAGNAPEKDETYTFVLKAIDNAPMPDGVTESEITASHDGAGSVSFGMISYPENGDYVYEVREIAGESADCIYDDTVYTVTMTVLNRNVTQKISIGDSAAEVVKFTNYYRITTALPDVSKAISGPEPAETESYSFLIRDAAGSSPMPEKTQITITGAESGNFGEITFEQDGTYVYEILEQDPGTGKNYDYDRTVYTLTYTVKDGNAVPSIRKGDATADSILFTNEYKALTGEVSVTKAITGKAPEMDETYSFVLKSLSNTAGLEVNPLPEDAVQGEMHVSRDGAGDVSFGEISFTKNGDYFYSVSEETSDSQTDCIYDDTEYTVKFEVSGRTVRRTITTGDTEVSAITFTNYYKVPAVIPDVAKTIDGPKPDPEETYTFTIAAHGDTPTAPLPETTVITIDGPARGSFGEVRFPADGTYKYVITENIPDDAGYTVNVNEFVITYTVANGAAHYTIQKDGRETEAGTDKFEFINSYPWPPMTRNIRVEKSITGSKPTEDQTYTFELRADPADAPMPNGAQEGKKEITITGEGKAEFGEITFSQTGTYSYHIKELPTNDPTCIDDNSEYVITVAVNIENQSINRTVVKSGRTITHESNIYNFTNYYKTTADLPSVTKAISGPEPAEDEDYVFVLSAVSPTNAPLPENTTLTITGADTGSFGSITFASDGTYSYKVTETVPEGADYTTDTPGGYTVTYVIDKGTVSRTITKDGVSVEAITFSNTYAPLTTTLPIQKKITGNTPLTADTYTFTLSADREGTPMPAETTVTITGAGSASFGPITYMENGEYIYTIAEEAPANPDCSYDKSVYQITVTVANRHITKTAVVRLNETETKYEQATYDFTNDYPDKPATVDFPFVRKVIDGPEQEVDETFTFIITPNGNTAGLDANPMPENTSVEIKQSDAFKGDGHDTAEFGAITFPKYGTYTYTVKETKGSNANCTYDESVYTIVWTMNGDGASYTIRKNGAETASGMHKFEFINSYPWPPLTTAPIIEKRITGTRPETDENFTFVLERISPADAPMPGAEVYDGNQMEVKITGENVHHFPISQFTEDGTYKYAIYEKVPKGDAKNENIIYDESRYEITLVIENREMKEITVTKDGASFERKNNIYLFTNHYRTRADFPMIHKTVSGPRPDEMEAFTIQAAADTPDVPMPTPAEIQIQGEGENSFGSVIFDSDGTYKYIITEKQIEGAVYEYDPAAYTVIFTVDKGIVHTEIQKNGVRTDKITFNNVYPSLEAALTVEKKITGNNKPSTPDSFTFSLAAAPETPAAPLPDNRTVTFSGEGTAAFDDIIFTENGIYSYIITEQDDAAIPDCTFDKTEYKVTFTVANGDYTRTAIKTLDGESTAYSGETYVFTNDYPDKPVTVTFPNIQKVIDGPKPEVKQPYTFSIQADADTPNAPLPNPAEITISGEDSKSFGSVTLTGNGTYKYIIKELPGADSSCTYDNTEYRITWTVNNGSASYGIERIAGSTEFSAQSFRFVNKYEWPDHVAEAVAIKAFAGNGSPDADEEFTFELKGIDGAPMPTGSVNGIKTVTATPQYKVKHFGPITFTDEGPYTYLIREIAGNDPNCTYDTTIYKAVVEYKEGTFTKKVYIVSSDSSETEIDHTSNEYVFTNTYDEIPVNIKLPIGKKILTGGSQDKNEEYTFILRSVRNTAGLSVNPLPGAEAGATQITVSRTGAGDISFGEITLKEKGTYVYEITEDKGTDPNCAYDSTIYTLTYTVENGDYTKSLTIGRIPVEEISFTNHYNTVAASPDVSKTVTGPVPQTAESFTFVITDKGSTVEGLSANPMPENKEISLSDGQSGNFGTITFTEFGTYTYEISEKPSGSSEYQQDTSIYTLTYVVENGNLTSTLMKGSESAETAAFTNEYTPVPANISVTKAIKGNTPSTSESYQFKLRSLSNDAGFEVNPMPQGASGDEMIITIQGAGSSDFGEISFTKNGSYLYEITEIAGSNNDCIYDETIYTVTISVENRDYTQNISIGDTVADQVEFTNYYKSKENLPAVVKEITGPAPDPADTFAFTITDAGNNIPGLDSNPMPAQTRIEITGPGSKAFGEISFEQDGTYYYTVIEEPVTTSDYIPDRSVYTLNYTVQDGTITSELKKDDAPAVAILFNNRYNDVPGVISVTKAIDGKVPENAETYTFVLTAKDGAPLPEGTSGTEITAELTGSGTVSFPQINFMTNGTYTYEIRERIGNNQNCVYDETVYTVTFTVTGQEVSKEIIADGEAVDDIVFTNFYHVPAEFPVITKVISGPKPDPEEEYSFSIEAHEDTPDAPLPDETTVTISGEGNASFTGISFPANGEYKYIIREVETPDAAYTRDTAVYTIIWTVKNGKAEYTILKNEEEPLDKLHNFRFVNIYKPETDTVDLIAEKIIQGTAPEGAVFAFTLEALSPENAPMPENAKDGKITIEIEGEGTAHFGEFTIPYDEEQTEYIYRIYEEPGEDESCTYDDSQYIVSFSFVDKNLITKISQNGNVVSLPDNILTFTNVYTNGAVFVDPPVKKEVIGGSGEDDIFIFSMRAVSNSVDLDPAEMPMPENAVDGVITTEITGSGQTEFGRFELPVIGGSAEYVYEIIEEPGELSELYEYDTTVYTITYTASLDEETQEPKAEMTILSNGEETDLEIPTFRNTRKEIPAIAPHVHKIITGGEHDEQQEAETFLFSLTAVSNTVTDLEQNPMPEDAKDGKSYIEIKGSGHEYFGLIEFPADGDYVYEIKEEPGSSVDYEYDSAVYTVTYTVEGKEVSQKVERNGTESEDHMILFENIYTKGVGTTNPTVKKIVKGNPSEPHTFTFRLFGIENSAKLPANPMPHGAVNGVSEITITGSGTKRFGSISFEKPGQYTYQIDEINDGAEGYQYDNSIYTLIYQVTAKEDGVGTDVKMLVRKNQKETDLTILTFTNIYDDGSHEDGNEEPVEQESHVLPKTGFAPGRPTALPEMRFSFSSYSQMMLRIPGLGVNTEILGVPKTDGEWDVAWLGDNAGWLQGTAWPASSKAGNAVLTGHSYNHLGRPGIFSNLHLLGYGSPIYISAFGETYVYSVEDVKTVYADTPQVLSQDTDHPKLTLITCKYFNEATGEYDGRIIVTARLESIQ